MRSSYIQGRRAPQSYSQFCWEKEEPAALEDTNSSWLNVKKTVTLSTSIHSFFLLSFSLYFPFTCHQHGTKETAQPEQTQSIQPLRCWRTSTTYTDFTQRQTCLQDPVHSGQCAFPSLPSSTPALSASTPEYRTILSGKMGAITHQSIPSESPSQLQFASHAWRFWQCTLPEFSQPRRRD
jgi:hypothetical protein